MHDLESARILIATSRSDGDRLNHKCVRPLTYQDNQSSYCYQILQVAGLVSEALLIHYSLNIQLRENPRETRKTWLLKCISDGNELPYLNKRGQWRSYTHMVTIRSQCSGEYQSGYFRWEVSGI